MNLDEREVLIIAQERIIFLNHTFKDTKIAYYKLLFGDDEEMLSDYDKRLIARNQEVIDQIQKMLDGETK